MDCVTKIKNNNKSGKLSINLIANITAFVIHAGIQFWVVPFLSQNVGNEAYGFISVANEFVQYANVFTVLLNGVVGRFVAYEIHRGELKRANQYFNSALIANIVIVTIFSIVGIIFVSKVENFLVISTELITDVKIIFGLTFLNFLIVTLFSVMSVATFVKNRIDVAAIRNIIGYFIEMSVVAALFLLSPVVKSYYLITGTLISTLYLAIVNVFITRRLLPEINISVKFLKFDMMKNMLKIGIWSSVSQMSNILLGSTTTILGNIFLGGNVVGLISLAKTLPNCLNTLFYTIYNVFTPNMIKSYAQNDIDGMVEQGKESMKIMSFLVLPIIVGIFVFAPEFFCLWLPGKNSAEIEIIIKYCRIIILGMIVEVPSMPLMYFAVATNKIREDTLFTLCISGILLGVSFIGLKYFFMDGEIIVLSQTANVIIIFLLWIPMYAAKTVGKNKFIFYNCYMKSILTTFGIGIIYMFIKASVHIDSWIGFIFIALLAGCFGYIFSFILILSKQQKKQIIYILEKVVKKNV